MPAQEIFVFREEIIPAGKVTIAEGAKAPSCPYCAGQDLVLRGTVSHPYQETIQGGRTTEHTTLNTEDMDFELTSFDCRRCFVRFIVKSDSEIEMLEIIQYLQGRLGVSELC